jgi:hypothetical protein
MSQRASGYERKERDLYETPEWVTECLRPHLPAVSHIWEPACGSGKMVRALEGMGYEVFATDIESGKDFLNLEIGPKPVRAIVTNPPYKLAVPFIIHAVAMMKPMSGFVAMLLRTDFDHAKGRNVLFTGSCFAKKVVLTKRIKWFEDTDGQPSFNHAWYIWNWSHKGPPVLAYGPQDPQ